MIKNLLFYLLQLKKQREENNILEKGRQFYTFRDRFIIYFKRSKDLYLHVGGQYYFGINMYKIQNIVWLFENAHNMGFHSRDGLGLLIK